MTVKELLAKIVEGSIKHFYSLDAENSAIVEASTLVNLDEEGNIYFTVNEVFAAVTVFTADNEVLHEVAWHKFDHVYLDKNEEVFETIGQLENSEYYKDKMVKALYKYI